MTVSRHVDAPSERVWAVLTDLEHSPEVIRAIESVEIHTGTGFDVGTRWMETRTMMGRTASETMEVTALDPGRSYVVEADSSGTHYRSEFVIAPDDGGTTVTMTFDGQPSTLAGGSWRPRWDDSSRGRPATLWLAISTTSHMPANTARDALFDRAGPPRTGVTASTGDPGTSP